jgi:hypothetical protein
VLERILRLVAVVASLLVIAGWGLFAIDQSTDASKQSIAEIKGLSASSQPNPSPDEERAREKAHGSLREGIDDANDVLLRPFAGLVSGSSSQWVRRSIPALLALLVYGFGIGFVARLVRTGG